MHNLAAIVVSGGARQHNLFAWAVMALGVGWLSGRALSRLEKLPTGPLVVGGLMCVLGLQVLWLYLLLSGFS